jgi:hypothetical protein
MKFHARHRIESTRCPSCKRELTTHAGLDDSAPPKAGDLSVCAYCQVIVQFTREGTFRQVTADEINDLPVDLRRQLIAAQALCKRAMAERRRAFA